MPTIDQGTTSGEPGVLLLQPWWGVTPAVRWWADRLVAAGRRVLVLSHGGRPPAGSDVRTRRAGGQRPRIRSATPAEGKEGRDHHRSAVSVPAGPVSDLCRRAAGPTGGSTSG